MCEARTATWAQMKLRRHQGSGLKGPVAEWCRRHIRNANGVYHWDGQEGQRVSFHRVNPQLTLEQQIGSLGATRALFAIGFERAHLVAGCPGVPPVTMSGADVDTTTYNTSNGMIAGIPSLYGAGIGYPHSYLNSDGLLEPWVGFGFGIKNAQTIVACWQLHL